MATIEQLEQALIKAHRAGDDRAAKLITNKIQVANADSYMGAPSDEATFGEKVVGGLKHAWDKAAYGLEGAAKGVLGLDIDKGHKADLERGRAFVDRAGGAAKVAEFAGDVVPFVAGGAGAIRAGLSLPMAMLAQGAIGATVTPESFGERMKSGALAAGGEGVGNVLMKSIARLTGGIKNVTPEAQRMIDEGIYPTLGGLKGGVLKTMEDKLSSIPGLGDSIAMGRRGAIDEANLAALSRGLPEGAVTDIGHKGFGQVDDYFEKAFGDATGGIRFDLNDPAVAQAVMDVARRNNLTRSGIDDMENFFTNARHQRGIQEPTVPGTAVATKVDPNVPTYISGKDYHDVLKQIRQEGTTYRRSQNPDQQKYGMAMRDMYDEMNRLARQQGVSDAGALDAFDAVRRQYAQVAPAIRAGNLNNVAGKNKGVFSPAQYENANASNMKAQGQTGMLRRGEGKNQQFANDMNATLGSGYPDSGTVGRALAGGLMLGEFAVAPQMLALTGAGYALNSQAGRKYLAGALPGQKALAAKLRSYAPMGGAAGAALVGQTGSNY